MDVCCYKLANTSVFMCMSSWENITYEFVLNSLVVSIMSCWSFFDGLRMVIQLLWWFINFFDGLQTSLMVCKWLYNFSFVRGCFQNFLKQLRAFLISFQQNVNTKLKKNCWISMTAKIIGKNSFDQFFSFRLGNFRSKFYFLARKFKIKIFLSTQKI